MKNENTSIAATKIILLFFAIPILIFTLNYSGFCFSKFRYLSSKEKMESLFNIWNKSVFDNIVIDGEFKVLERKNRYANFDEFLEKHPNCCEIDPGGPYDMGAPFFINRIMGYDSGTIISFKFNEEYIEPDGNIITQEINVLDSLQNCGESRW